MSSRTAKLVACLVLGSFSANADAANWERYQPAWHVGDAWVVETAGRHVVRRAGAVEKRRWRLVVSGLDALEGRKCWRVDVFRQPAVGRQPNAILWYDEHSKTLRRTELKILSPNGVRTVSESFEAPGGQPYPALSSIAAPPVSLPLFHSATKSAQSFFYLTGNRHPEEKSGRGIGFAHEVTQQVAIAGAGQAEVATIAGFEKSAGARDSATVVIRGANQTVQQTWQTGLPWPTTSVQGDVNSRLISVHRVKPRGN